MAAGRELGVRVWEKWKAALPVNLFFLVLSGVMMGGFGTEYALTIAGITVLFQLRMEEENSLDYCLRLFAGNLLLCALAMAASLHVVLCVLLNLAAPFTLVLLQSDQFSPKGYFPYLMCFAFLELRPPAPRPLGPSCW